MAIGVQVWSQTPASNATADSNINFAEGMAPSQMNDSCRSLMGSVAKWRDDNTGVLVTSGTSSALTVVTNQIESALTTGFTVTATLGSAVAASATLAVDGLATAPIYTSLSTASQVTTGSLALGQITSFVYSTAITGVTKAWIVKSASPTAAGVSLTSISTWLGADVSMTTTGFFDGPSVSVGTTGIWYAIGTVSVTLPVAGGTDAICKLWDGTTVINSATGSGNIAGGTLSAAVTVAGIISNPVGNIKMSAASNRNGAVMSFNFSGSGQDCNITAIRIG